MHCRYPVKYLDGAGHSNYKGKQGECIKSRTTHSGSKHMMSPHKISYKCNSENRTNHEFISEYCFMRESCYYLGNCSHCRQDHNAVSYTHLRAHETVLDIVCRLLLEKKKKK